MWLTASSATLPDGTLVVAWLNGSTIFAARSTDGGTTSPPPSPSTGRRSRRCRGCARRGCRRWTSTAADARPCCSTADFVTRAANDIVVSTSADGDPRASPSAPRPVPPATHAGLGTDSSTDGIVISAQVVPGGEPGPCRDGWLSRATAAIRNLTKPDIKKKKRIACLFGASWVPLPDTSAAIGRPADAHRRCLYRVPFIPLVIVLEVLFGRNFLLVFVAIGAVSWLDIARMVRGQTLSIRAQEYMEAARRSACARRR